MHGRNFEAEQILKSAGSLQQDPVKGTSFQGSRPASSP